MLPNESSVARWVETRPWEVRVLDTFVQQMRVELAANAGKGDRPGWLAMNPRELLAEIQHHYVKLHAVVVEMDRTEDGHFPRPVPWGLASPELIAEFAADVANMAMMLADRCGALEVPVPALLDPDAAAQALPEAEQQAHREAQESIINARRQGERIAGETWIG